MKGIVVTDEERRIEGLNGHLEWININLKLTRYYMTN